MDGLAWRAPERGDIPQWVELLRAVSEADGLGEVLTTEDLADEFASRWSDPARNATFAWDGAGRLVAFGWLRTVPGDGAAPDRITCWGAVHPGARGRGIGRDLLARQLARARELAATIDGTDTAGHGARIDLEVPPSSGAHRLAQRAGFRPLRRYVDLARRLPRAGGPPEPAPARAAADTEIVPWTPALDAEVREALNAAFADHFDARPVDVDAWRQWYSGHRSFRPDLSFVALADGRAAGAALGAAYPQDWALTGAREAWITRLGVRPGHRRRGLAGALLARAVAAAAEAPDGFDAVLLGADAGNASGALELYERFGFEPVREVVLLCWTASRSIHDRRWSRAR